MKTQITFIRKDRCDIDQLVVVEFSLNGNFGPGVFGLEERTLHALESAVTAWVEKTTEGRALYEYSSGDLNIGDLLSGDTTGLDVFLSEQGIESMDVVFQLSEAGEASYDRLLASGAQLDD